MMCRARPGETLATLAWPGEHSTKWADTLVQAPGGGTQPRSVLEPLRERRNLVTPAGICLEAVRANERRAFDGVGATYCNLEMTTAAGCTPSSSFIG